jgi:hypothetical protein
VSTFLQLCQDVARECRRISGGGPATVVAQTGALLDIVRATDKAWDLIQSDERTWLWMRKALPATALTSIGVGSYTAAIWGVTDQNEWIRNPLDKIGPYSIYESAAGNAQEGFLQFIEYDSWYRAFNVGPQENAQPVYWSISPAGEFLVGPLPDKVYRIRGPYQKSNQSMTLDAHVPECPAKYHPTIVRRALILLAAQDENTFGITTSQKEYLEGMDTLRREQLPRKWTCGPLA